MGICDGEIKGDPDIAGTGVVVAMFINAAVSMLLSTFLWLYLFSIGKNRLDRSEQHPWWIPALRDTLVMQGDSQLICGLAIMVASLINIYMDDETPLYHIYVAHALVDLCLYGHTWTIALLPRTEYNWAVRLWIVFSCVVLWEFWNFVAIDNFERWNWHTPRCLENNNIFGGEYEDWMRVSLVWVPLNYTTIYLSSWDWGSQITDQFEDSITAFPKFAAIRVKQVFKSLTVLELFENTVIAALFTVSCLVFLAFAILIPSCRTLLPLQALVTFWWDAYDVAKVRAANAHIVVANPQYRLGKSFQNNDNPEHDWGFGQILPFVMLLLPILTALDFVKRASDEGSSQAQSTTTSQAASHATGQQKQVGTTRRRTAQWPTSSQ